MVLADQMDRQLTFGEILAHGGFHFGSDGRQWAGGKNDVTVLLKVAAKGLALLPQIAGGLSEKNRFADRLGGSGALWMLEHLQQAANVVR